jgi:hypothetical protein
LFGESSSAKMTTVTIQVPKEGASVELMLVGDTPSGEATLILPDGVIVRPPPLQWQLPDGVNLEADRFGWSADLASKGAAFFGHSVALKIDTSASPMSGPPPPPGRAELALASVIVQSLSTVLSLCEAKFSEDTCRYDGTAMQHVRAPHIWISTEFIGEGSSWSFVVSRDDAPDFGCHLEFDGLRYLGISAGD